MSVGGDPGCHRARADRDRAGSPTTGAEELGRGLAGDAPPRRATPSGRCLPGAPDDVLRVGLAEIELAESETWPALYAEQMLAPLAARADGRGQPLGPRTAVRSQSVCERIDSLCGPRGAAVPPPWRPVERQRPRRLGRPRLADRPGGLRRPPRGRPGDAAPLRLAERADLRRVRGGVRRWPTVTRIASSSGSFCRCSSTRSSSAARTGRRPGERLAGTSDLPIINPSRGFGDTGES